ncbi:galactose-specific lectin nattectin-like isoform X2 [Xiphophorus hellerii]|uniref:galactose-specific lectin nattectin-like isoform X2 n=1 Tax=Xiphophorus hellerii TaxID=8084 RepID=UPI0013B422C7|nr:galactose-specific lectin nattectin-like isoform X2 [Xiphophorus hellerii]
MASVLYFALLLSLSCVLCIGAKIDLVPLCPTGWSEFGNRCFLFQNTQTDWATAERACNDLGANLASICNSNDHNFLKNLVNSKKGSYERTWVGGHDGEKEGVWLWSDGSKFTYNQWGSGEPNNYGGNENCMEINLKGSIIYLNDEGCTRNSFSICAKNF